MQQTQKHEQEKISPQSVSFEFLNKGLACHALCLLEYVGVCKILVEEGKICETSIFSSRNPALLRAALVTLVGANVLLLSEKTYQFSVLGKALYENIDAIFMPLVGYRRLLAKQFELAADPHEWDVSDIDYSAIAQSSANFAPADLDPLLLEIFRDLQPRGTICDLGCGTGERLAKICNTLNAQGLGIEKDPNVIRNRQQCSQYHRHIEILQGDITQLKGIWEDVDITLLSMVYHDITPAEKAVEFLRSIRTHFPHLRHLIITDIVSISDIHPTILPGFDYVHGLQGIIPRNYEQTVQTLRDAHFRVIQEVPVPNIPNMLIWVARPQN